MVDDPGIKAALKESSGIGTDATRQDIIPNLKNRGFVTSASGRLVPTSEGMTFYQVLERCAPQLLDVGLTGQMEIALEAVKSRAVGARTAVEAIVKLTEHAVARFIEGRDAGLIVLPPPMKGRKGGRSSGKAGKTPGRPTDKMRSAALAKAKREGATSPPDGVLDDFDKCRAYLGPLPERGADGAGLEPSEKQTAYAPASPIGRASRFRPPPWRTAAGCPRGSTPTRRFSRPHARSLCRYNGHPSHVLYSPAMPCRRDRRDRRRADR